MELSKVGKKSDRLLFPVLIPKRVCVRERERERDRPKVVKDEMTEFLNLLYIIKRSAIREMCGGETKIRKEKGKREKEKGKRR